MWRHLWRHLFILSLFINFSIAQISEEDRHKTILEPVEAGGNIQNFQFLSQFLSQSPKVIEFNQTIPDKVIEAKENSFAPVYISFLRNYGGEIDRDSIDMAGFVVFENYVLTALHFNKYPSIWKDENTIFQVVDGKNHFFAKIVYHEPYPSPFPLYLPYGGYSITDLVLLEVLPHENLYVKFSKKPATLAKATYVMDKATNKYKIINDYRKFYMFYLNPATPRLILPLEVGPYLSIDNFDDPNVFMGTIQGPAQPGFSGSFLLTPDGEVLGVATWTDRVYTRVITIETIHEFLKKAKQALNLN